MVRHVRTRRAAGRDRRRARRAPARSVRLRHAPRRRRRRARGRRRRARRRLHDRGEHEQPARAVRDRRRMGWRHGSSCTTPRSCTSNVRTVVAGAFGIPEPAVRVHMPYLAGGFGAGLRAWPHVVLAALAARVAGRPVKLVLTRPEMFTGVGHRPRTVQRIRLGATREGDLVAMDHDALQTVAMEDDNRDFVSLATTGFLRLPEHVRARPPAAPEHPVPGLDASARERLKAASRWSRPSTSSPTRSGSTRWSCGCATTRTSHPQLGLPWSSKALRECFAVGAKRFGWSDSRSREPGSMSDGRWRVGYGVAGISWPWVLVRAAQARVTIDAAGTAVVRSAAQRHRHRDLHRHARSSPPSCWA